VLLHFGRSQWLRPFEPPCLRLFCAGFVFMCACVSTRSALLKEAYVGEPSRAYFPLTTDFAVGSNNSTVAMSNIGVVIPVCVVARCGCWCVREGVMPLILFSYVRVC